MTPSLEFYLRQINAPKVCITSVCVFISSLCMAWMLSIKYFVFFTQILRFSLNWRTHLQNDVIFGILFASESMPQSLVLHLFVIFISSWCMAWMLSIKYFVIFTQISRFSLNWQCTSTKWRHSLLFILRQINAAKVCFTSVCVFFSSLMYGLNVIDQILCLFLLKF